MSGRNVQSCLIILFQRFEHFEHIIHRLSRNGVSRFYLAIDGARSDIESESQNRFLMALPEISVKHSVTFHLSHLKKNYGIFINMITALDWFFEENEFGLILEDDTIPSVTFCEFIQGKYLSFASNSQSLMISGWRDKGFSPTVVEQKSTCKFPMIWGWATSQMKWQVMRKWFFENATLKPQFIQRLTPSFGFWQTGYKRAISGKLDSWANVIAYNYFLGNYNSIIPDVSMIENVGLDEFATNTRIRRAYGKVRRADSLRFLSYERWLEKNVFRISFRHILAPFYAPIIDLVLRRSKRVRPIEFLQQLSNDGLSGLTLRDSL